MKTAIPLRKSEDSLIEKYYKKLKKSTSPKVAAQFYQIEHYISLSPLILITLLLQLFLFLMLVFFFSTLFFAH